jgi:cytochrome d ubiquinol oxidase subunit II
METLWFWLVALMITAYVILDGFDLGAGIIHLTVAHTDSERRAVLSSIGPFWDGNEVWLLAGAGTLYFAFPSLYSTSFSGFYLPLMIVLWLLILRGISIEFRSHLNSLVWTPLWDAAFCGASILLSVFFGAALGNVIRGVPFDAQRQFFLPLWTHFRITGAVGILDWYTITVGLLAAIALTHHGALWVAFKTAGSLRERCRAVAGIAWWILVLLTVLATAFTFAIQPQISRNLTAHQAGFVFPALAVGGLIAAAMLRRYKEDLKAFLASCAYLAGMLTSAAFGVFPYVLPSNNAATPGLTIFQAATSGYGLKIGLFWWIPGVLLAAAYFTYVYRHFRGKVEENTSNH